MQKRQLKKTLEGLGELQRKAFSIRQDKDTNLYFHYGDGRKEAVLPITLRPYQHALHAAYYHKGFKRFFEVLPRRAGKEVESWTLIVKEAILNPGPYAMIYPTYAAARKILWNGFLTIPGSTEVIRFLNFIPKCMIARVSQQAMEIELTNGSIISFFGSEKYDRLRGINLKGAVFSEYAWSDPRAYRVLMPVFKNSQGFYILQTTYDGMNHAYHLMQKVKKDSGWFTREESALTLLNDQGERYITDEMIDESRRDGMPEYLIQQEYFSVVCLNESINYFARAVKTIDDDGRYQNNLYDPVYPVHIAFDIGVDDATALVFFQLPQKNKPSIIYYLEDHRKDISFYLEKIDRYLQSKQLRKGYLILPHDGNNQSWQTGKTSKEWLEERGEWVVTTPRLQSLMDGIRVIREYIYRSTFDKIKTERLIECLSNYRQEFDDKRGVYKETPCHDWSSHGVKAFQTLSLALDRQLLPTRTETEEAVVGCYL